MTKLREKIVGLIFLTAIILFIGSFAGTSFAKIYNPTSTSGFLSSLTPWTENIDGATYNLTGVGHLGMTTASSTQLTVSGQSWIGTVLSGIWNGTAIDISDYTNLVAGTNISLSGDTLNVDDAFLVNNANDSTTGTITSTGFIVGDGQTVGATTNKWLFDDSNGDITTTGKLGIATSSPLQTLAVQGTAGTDIFNVASSTGASLFKVAKEGYTKLGALITSATKSATDGATVNIDWLNGNVQSVTLAGNRTLTFSNVQVGGSLKLYVTQDGTGSRTLSTPAGVHWKDATAPTLSTGANATDILVYTTATSTATIYGSYSTGY